MSSRVSESPSDSSQDADKTGSNSTTPPVNPPPVLARGSACHQCRKRKLKCDGHRPVCNLCSKPRPKLNPNNEPPVCTWDELPDPEAASRRKRRQANDTSSKKARIQELEDRVAAFESAWKQSQESAVDPRIKPLSIEREVRISDLEVPVTFASSNLGRDPIGLATGADTSREKIQTTGGAFDIISPDWSLHLPPLEIVEHIVQVFFARVPTVSKMMHRATFLSSLRLPPSHSRFPAPALLHAILAITTPHLPECELLKREYFPIGTPLSQTIHPIHDLFASPRVYLTMRPGTGRHPRHLDNGSPVRCRFQQWHRRKALEEILDEVADGRGNMLQTMQAQILITVCDAQNAWWTEVWCEAGMCLRMAVPLQLNESSQHPDDSLQQKRRIVLPRTQDPLQQAVRDRTFWIAYIVERTVGMATSWSDFLPEAEITVELPVTQDIFDSGVGQLVGTQTIHSPDLLSSHPDHHADGFVLQVKALKLYTDVCRFFRRYARGSHSTAVYLQHPDLYKFLMEVNTLRHSVPPHLRRPAQIAAAGSGKLLDVDLFTSSMIIYATVIFLGEPLITREMVDSEMAKNALGAIRAVLSLLYDITTTSFDLSLLPFPNSHILFQCARDLCRFMDIAQERGDLVSAAVFRSECEVFRTALERQAERYPVAARQLKMLDEVLKEQATQPPESRRTDLRMLGCTREDMFDSQFASTSPKPGPPSVNGASSYPGSTPGTTSTPSSFSPASVGISWPVGLGTPSPAVFPSATARTKPSVSGGSMFSGFGAGPGGLDGGIGVGGEGDSALSGMNMDWLDVANYSWDAETLANMIKAAETANATFELGALGSVEV